MASSDLHRVQIHGHEVVYRDVGEGPVLLLLHGIAGSSRAWREVMPALAGEYRMIAPDLIGHGESAKPVGDYSLGAFASGMRDLLGVLGVERATLVGQSFGGGVAMQLAYQHPEVCERLVLVDSGGLGREVSPLLRAVTLPLAEYVLPIVFPSFVRDRGDAVSRFLKQRGITSGRAAEMWLAYRSLTESDNRKAFVRTMRSVIDPGGQTVSAMDRLYLAAAVPTLIVWGEEDAALGVELLDGTDAYVRDLTINRLPGVSHWVQQEAPDQVNAILEGWLPGPHNI